LLEQEIIIAIMGIMTATAGHTAESKRVTAGFESVGTFFLMARETGFLLRECVKDPVSFAVHLVAGSAGDFFEFVGAAEPAQPPARFVAAKADLVLLGRRCFRIRSKGDWRQSSLSLSLAPSLRPSVFK
jgi:hypothetical protein